MAKIDKKIYFRRIVALPLVLFLAFVPAVPVAHASDPVTAATLAVTGGQLAAGGLAGEAGAAALAGPVGAVVGLALAACGVSAYVSSAAQAEGKTRTRFVADKLVIWGAQAGYSAEQLYQKIAQGISVAADGTIQLGNDAAKIIQQFGNWICSRSDLLVPSSSDSSSTSINLGSLNLPLGIQFPLGDYFSGSGASDAKKLTYTSAASVAFLILKNGNYYQIGFICDQATTITRTYIGPSGATTSNYNMSSNRNGYYYMIGNNSFPVSSSVVSDNSIVFQGTITQFIDTLDGTWDPSIATPHDEVFTGTPEAWAQNKDVLNPSADDTPITLNPDLLNPILDALADGTQATMSIKDYIDALQRAFDQALDDVKSGVAQLTDTVTGIQESIAIPDTAASNPSITNPSVEPSTVPVLDPSAVNPDAVITGFQFDLSQIFPFCLPFDVYHMLQLLDAEPVAPAYRFQFDVPIPGVLGHSSSSWRFDYTIDLSQFNAVAALLRKLELLSFCIGLAYVTRSMFIRS